MSNVAISATYAPALTGATVLQVLECFAIPFICFGDHGHVTRLSPAARSFLADVKASEDVVSDIARAVAVELGAADHPHGEGLFPLVRELPAVGIGGVISIRRPVYPDPSVKAVVVLGGARSAEANLAATLLTRRESEVARLIATGASNKHVAAQLGISAHTVRRHSERVFAKLGVRTRASLACVLS